MAIVGRTMSRQWLLPSTMWPLKNSTVSPVSSTAYEEMSKYWGKNRELGRPLSPFLSSYRPHLAMMTSLTHRVTGVVMQCSVALVSIGLMVFPGDFTHYLEMVRAMSLHPMIIMSLKAILAFPVTYHFINGIRHLVWDAGFGFGLGTLYRTAYFAMALTASVVAYFVFFL